MRGHVVLQDLVDFSVVSFCMNYNTCSYEIEGKISSESNFQIISRLQGRDL